jgi:hypothetical protein
VKGFGAIVDGNFTVGCVLRNHNHFANPVVLPSMVGALEIAIPALAFAKFGRSVTASVSQRRGLPIGI